MRHGIFPEVKLTSFPTPDNESITVSASANLSRLMDTYATMEFRSHLVEKLAQKFVDENYERLTTGTNFENIETSILDLVKQKFADLLNLEPTKKTAAGLTGPR